MKWSKLGAVLAAVLLVAGLAGAGASAALGAAASPKVVGVCTNTANGGYVRMLEARNLPKSQFGKCRKGEAKVLLPTTLQKGPKGDPGRGFDGKPFRLVLDGGAARVCTWTAATETLTCAVPSPSPSPSSTP